MQDLTKSLILLNGELKTLQIASISKLGANAFRVSFKNNPKSYTYSAVKWGIKGSDTIGKGIGSYVKYDPAYIYNSGLQTFEILRSPQVVELIYSASKAIHNTPNAQKSDDENIADDALDKAGF